jgi:ParB/RepB/Spo0J family partition protein
VEYRNANELKIVDEPKHPLFDERASEEPPQDFIENVEEFGVIEPVVINEEDEVVEGRKRVKTCRLLDLEVPCILVDHENQEAIMHSANIHRHGDKPSVLAKKAIRMLRRDSQSKQAVAKTFGKTVKQIENYIKFESLHSSVRKYVDKSFTGDQQGLKLTMSEALKWAGMPVNDQKSNLEDMQRGHKPGLAPPDDGSDNGKKKGVPFNWYASKHVRRLAKTFLQLRSLVHQKTWTQRRRNFSSSVRRRRSSFGVLRLPLESSA